MSLPLQPISLDELQRADARWLLAYWKSKAARDDLPRCESTSSVEMRAMAADLMSLEPTGATGELRYRQVGAAITARFGADLTGRTLCLDSTGGWAAAFQEAIAERRPVALRGRVSGAQSVWSSFEAVVLPRACPVDDGVCILAGMFFFDD